MNKKYIVSLSNEERDLLKALVNHGKKAVQKVKRAWILLQADASPDGPAWSDEQIQKAYGVGLVTIYRVRQTFVEEGTEAVLNRRPKSRHRHRRLDGEEEARLIALACSKPPPGRKRWTVRLLAGKFVELGKCERVCPETVRQTLKKTNSSRIW
jgi:Homeodomain-like domain